MNLFNISVLCFGFSALLLGLIIYLRRQDKLGKLWFIFSILCGLWAIGYSFQINNDVPYDRALWVSRSSDAVAIFIPAAWLRFIYEYFGRRASRKLFLPIYVISGAILLTFPTNLFIPSLKDKSNIGVLHFVEGGLSFHLFTVLFATVVLYGFYLIVKEYKKVSLPDHKKQIGYLLLSSALGFSGGSTAFLPVYDIDFPVLYGALLLPAFPFLMALAMTRYRLLDIEEIAQAAQRDKLAAIGTLATSINHEIRNPLFVIKASAESHLENLREGIYTNKDEIIERSNQVLATAVEQCQRAVDIMKRFALFARQGTKEESQAEDVNLSETFESILPLVRHEMELDGIEMTKDIPNNLSPVRADRRHLEEIFFNLIVNACQAMKGGGKLTVRAEQRNGRIQIEIEDKGPGIPSDQLRRIFEPFYTTKESGTGLGLYITKQLVERNHGKIRVKSKIGKGTTFILTFPAVQSTRGVSRVAPPTPTSEAALVKEEMT